MSENYFALPGLSQSGMKDLAVSPLRYWHLNINPNRPVREETPAMAFGTAVHCKVLEPARFPTRYCKSFDPSEYPDALRTAADLSGWLKSNGQKSSGLKPELIERVLLIDPCVPIIDVLEARYEDESGGRTRLSAEFWRNVHGCAEAISYESSLAPIFAEGRAEVPMTARDPKTGVMLKAKMDWVAPSCILDLKTFSQMRGKSIDKTVTDAIWYERYFRQAYFYSYVRSLQPDGWRMKDARFLLVFVESEPPHEVRIRELLPCFGEVNVYWEQARHEVNDLIALYAQCVEKFGEKP